MKGCMLRGIPLIITYGEMNNKLLKVAFGWTDGWMEVAPHGVFVQCWAFCNVPYVQCKLLLKPTANHCCAYISIFYYSLCWLFAENTLIKSARCWQMECAIPFLACVSTVSFFSTLLHSVGDGCAILLLTYVFHLSSTIKNYIVGFL